MNLFSGIGRIGRDAEVRQAGGSEVTSWAVAIDSGYGDKKQTIWIDCSMWGQRGAKIAEYIRKGDRIGVQGEIGTREHNSKFIVTLKVADVTLLGEKAKGSAPAQPRQSAKPPVDDFEDSSIPF